jgi:serine O-acetyltransferase
VPDKTSSSLASAPEGILYSASGDSYVAEALRSARSSLRHNSLPHLVFASADVDDGAAGVSIARFEPSANPYVDKIANMRRSPFERTLYLDSDTFVVDEIAHVLRLLDRYDMAAAYAPAYRGLADPEVPPAFYEFNTGVLAWRASERMAAFMRSWEETYVAWLSGEPFPGAGKASRGRRADQPAFRRCAWEHDVRLFVLAPEYNFRLGYPTTVVERVRVIHGEQDDYETLAARINDRERPRPWPPPPPLSLRAKVMRRIRKAGRASPAGPTRSRSASRAESADARWAAAWEASEMRHDRLHWLKHRMRKLWLFSPERLWLASIALNRRGHWVLAFWLKQLNGLVYHNSLAPGASVSPDIFLGHNSLGIVINRNVEIGRGVTIWHNVTLAAGRPERPARRVQSQGHRPRDDAPERSSDGSPTPRQARIIVEDNVRIGANAVIIAPRGTTLRIGRGARIGAGTVVTKDIPAKATIVGAAPRLMLADDDAKAPGDRAQASRAAPGSDGADA